MPNPQRNSNRNKNNNQKRGKRNDNRRWEDDQKKQAREEEVVKQSREINDASYYFTDATLRDQISNITFNQFTGVSVDLGDNVAAGAGRYVQHVPYLMTIQLNPSAGYTTTGVETDGLYLAALSNYTRLSANNAKTSQYAPQDILMLYLAVGQLIAITSHYTRIFGCVKLYNYRNRAYPKSIIEGLGVDYDDFSQNLANYRIRFNTLLVAMSRIPIPANVPYFMKCAELYSGLYADMQGSPMSQTYAFVPSTTWTLDETYSEQGSGLRTTAITNIDGTTKQFTQLLDVLEVMVNALLTSSTLNAIYSDLLRLADKEGLQLMSFQTVSEDYTIVPAYVPEIRLWINNLVCVEGQPQASPSGNFTPNNDVQSDAANNTIKYRPYWSTAWSALVMDSYINFDYPNPDPSDVLYATRLIPKFYATNNGTTAVMESATLPDHYPVACLMFMPDVAPIRMYSTNQGSSASTMAMVAAASNFDWHPPIVVTNGASGQITGIVMDLNYYTTVNYKYLKSLNDATMQGLFEMR